MIDTAALKLKVTLFDLIRDIDRKDGRCACPIHQGHDKTAFHVYDNGTRWKCFSGECGSGDVISFVMARDGVDFKRAVDILGGSNEITPAELTALAEVREKQAAVELADKQREYKEAVKDLQNAHEWEAWHDDMTDLTRAEWRKRGISDAMQDYWKFGYCPNFTYDGEHYHSPALSIPVYAPAWELVTVRMRLLQPHEEKSKYRPIYKGLQSAPFIAEPALGYDNADRYLIIEGEIKAAVVYQTWDNAMGQVIGIAGKDQKKMLAQLAGDLKGKDVFVCFDPDALPQAVQFARDCGGAKVINFSRKIDDAINEYGLTKDWLEGLMKSAKYIEAK